jgi:hypothetical protein
VRSPKQWPTITVLGHIWLRLKGEAAPFSGMKEESPCVKVLMIVLHSMRS